MAESFITNIFVENSRNITNLEIPLANDHRQHLILTGKNGSGKTSLLLELNKFLSQIENNHYRLYSQNKSALLSEQSLENKTFDEIRRQQIIANIKSFTGYFSNFGGTKITFSNDEFAICDKFQNGEFIIAYFDAKRQTNLTIPQGINKVNLKKKYNIQEKANINFVQYIVNLKADRSFAKDDNEEETVAKIDAWFEKLENRLKIIFDVEHLELHFDRKNYNFDIITDSDTPFSFTTLSDGYSAIISIVTELLLRMEAHNSKSYDLEGIVLIDEIETHLHIGLQKKILPFLTDFFPKIQFIVTTHSPFVLSSLSNATICDLETKIVTTDLSSYSYDALIESYFKNDKYSEEVKEKVVEYESLILKTDKTIEDKMRLKFLRD